MKRKWGKFKVKVDSVADAVGTFPSWLAITRQTSQ